MFDFKNTIIEIIFHMASIFTLGICVGALFVYFDYLSPDKLAVVSLLIAIIFYCSGRLFDDKSKKELGDIE